MTWRLSIAGIQEKVNMQNVTWTKTIEILKLGRTFSSGTSGSHCHTVAIFKVNKTSTPQQQHASYSCCLNTKFEKHKIASRKNGNTLTLAGERQTGGGKDDLREGGVEAG